MVLVLHLNILCDHSSFVFLVLLLFLGFALHNIHAFHDRLLLLFFFFFFLFLNVFCIISLELVIKIGHIIFT